MSHVTEALEVTPGEVLPVVVDVTAVLAPGDVVQSIQGRVFEQTGGAEVIGGVMASPVPAVADLALSFTLDARLLKPRNRYQGVFLLTVAPNAKVLGVIIPMTCAILRA